MRHKALPSGIQHAPRGVGRHRLPGQSHRLRNGLLITAGVLVLFIAAGAWIGVRALTAKDSLEHAQSLVGELKGLAEARDFEGIQKLSAQLTDDTNTAAAMTSDPIWRVAELVPVLGKNLVVVRELADVVDSVASDAVGPLVAATSGGLDAFKPKDGRFDVELIAHVADKVENADAIFTEAGARLDALDTAGTVGQVSAAAAQLDGLIDKYAPLIHSASSMARVLPAALGADSPRSYILLFQNNAESMSFGGNTAAWVVLGVDDGALKITSQPNSEDFARDLPIPIELDQSLLDLYNPDYFRYATNLTLRPDFPTDARLAQAFWQRFSSATVDGVVALDPIALSYLLTATGPLTLPSGVVLSSDNAVSLLLSDVYKMYENPADQDVFFAQAASAVFTAMTSTSPDINKLIDAVTHAITDNRLMAWSSHPEEEELLAETQLAGILAVDNKKKTEVGVFFVENSASKMSYYMRTNVVLATTVCQPDLAPGFSATVTLHSDISPEAYDDLSAYVRSGVYKDPDRTRTLVFVYGPPGATFSTWSWDGASLGAELITTGTDLGRPVAQVAVDLEPGQASTIKVDFSAPAGDYGPLQARVTPMVQPTIVALDAPGCAPAAPAS